MTEAEWLECSQTERLWEFLKRSRKVAKTNSGKRKLRLWAAACARFHILASKHRNPDNPKLPLRHAAVEVVERFADGLANRDDLQRVSCMETLRLTSTKVEEVFTSSNIYYVNPDFPTSKEVELFRVTAFREIFGNPFRPFTLGSVHRTQTIKSLAQAAYDENRPLSGELDPQRLAILADALEENGASGEILDHLRAPGPHFRGCQVVDLCMGVE